MTAHAKNYAPSAAKRWLSCCASPTVVSMYPNNESDASLKGDYWHKVMEDTITFGCVPSSADPDLAEAMDELLDYVKRRMSEMGKSCRVYVETRLDIPETGEFGTGDIILVSDQEIEVIDLKSGYVPVDVHMNPQLLLYLLGCFPIYGHKRKYRLTVCQPNYDHIDGPIRSYDPTDEDIDWFRQEIKYALANPEEFKAGKHCKETYCAHRGACVSFALYTKGDLSLGWHTSEINAIDDGNLAKALDAADELSGYRNELRAEAMRRIANMDRRIEGYKIVKGRKQRSVHDPEGLLKSLKENLGEKYVLGCYADSLVRLVASKLGLDAIPADAPLGSPKQIEDVIKQYARDHKAPRNGWKNVYETVAAPYIRETNSGLTLEKAIDGRPAHKRGSEFTSLAPDPEQSVSII